ncbi:MAG: c-type cytochrome [Thermodesulfovibrionales bacterium]
MKSLRHYDKENIGDVKGVSMKTMTSILVQTAGILLLLISFVSAQGLPEEPTRGGRLFVAKGCAKCHAFKGTGSSIGPDLSKIDLGDTQLDLAAQIWNHTPAMITEMEQSGITGAVLTGQEFIEITSYLYFLSFFDEPGDPLTGENVFEQKGCSSCHASSVGKKGSGPELHSFPRNLSPVFLGEAIWNHSIPMIALMAQIGMKWPNFEGSEMMDILEYIKTQAKGPAGPAFFRAGNPKKGRVVYDSRKCNECHSIYGEGAKGGIDLATRARKFYTSLTRIVSSMWNKGPVVIVRMAQTQCCGPKFTSGEMADLLAYLYFLHYLDEPGDAVNGKRLFSDLACAGCHTKGGQKNAPLQYIDLSKYQNAANTEIVAGIWNHTIPMRKAVAKKGIPWPKLRKGEMADLLEFIRNPQEI